MQSAKTAPLAHSPSLITVFPSDFSGETCKADEINALLADATSKLPSFLGMLTLDGVCCRIGTDGTWGMVAAEGTHQDFTTCEAHGPMGPRS